MKYVTTQYCINNSALEIYLAGCALRNCDGCCNPDLWDFSLGTTLDSEGYKKLGAYISETSGMYDNFFIVGGEPLDHAIDKITALLLFLKQFKKKIWLFTRREIEEIDEEVLSYVDFVKCGKYVKELKCENNIQYGVKLATSNQKIIKVK